jgi:hypothetical protein
MNRRLRRALAAALLALSALTATGPASAADDPGQVVTLPLRQAIADLPVADENRTGYQRESFRHWVDANRNGCSTRSEVLLEEAVTAPQVGARCALSAGRWYSYYDDVYVDGPRGLDIDHLVPLAEAWDSGASQWTAARRQAYANDLGASTSLVTVTAASNRSKSDQDPAQWLPPYEPSRCRYITEWTGTKLRWSLTADPGERAALTRLAAGCPDVPVTVAVAE